MIEEMSGNFKPEKYKNSFTEDLKKLIKAKAKGKKIKRTPKAPPSTKVVDIMSVLQASIDQQSGGKKKLKNRAA